jgi:hypothetical protein
MANALYDKGRQAFLAGDLDWDANDIRLVFIDEDDDVPVLATDDFLDDIISAARVAQSGAFTGKSVTDGVADAADVTVTSVAGDEFESLTIYYHTGVDSTARLICNIDTATGLACTPNGGDIIVQWDAGADKIFKL